METCVFCNIKNKENEIILFENDYCLCVDSQYEELLVGSCIIIPKAHKVTVFDLSYEEWEATKQLIDMAKQYIDEKYNPDGYNVGWNSGTAAGQTVFHAHLHIIPRHADEPYAGRGIRSWIKREENRRPRYNIE